MGRLIRLAIKILPLITLYKGITSGGARMKPLLDMVKVTLTQYEVAEVTKLVVHDYKESNGLLVAPSDFQAFVQDKFHSQYSVVARELTGDKNHNLSRDIWGIPFTMIPNQDVTNIKITSAGPDKKLGSKDDISVDFNIKRNPNSQHAPTPSSQREPAANSYNEYDEEGYDRDGFDKQGYDRDGFDRNGVHQDEKNLYEEN